jgi:hypothetical protein
MTKRTIKDVGLTPDQIEYPVGHSQEINPPSDFDDEVQRYLDEWTARESKNSSFYSISAKKTYGISCVDGIRAVLLTSRPTLSQTLTEPKQ